MNPTALEPYLRTALPALRSVAQAFDVAWPFLETAFGAGMHLWRLIEPHSDSILPMLFGLALILFGGSLPLTVAAVEAFRLCGWWVPRGLGCAMGQSGGTQEAAQSWIPAEFRL